MTIRYLKTGITEEVNNEYALRLMEQGVAVPVEEAEKPKTEKPKAKAKKADDA